MSQMFNEKGKVIPVTIIETGPCYVAQIKTKEKDKYESIQIGFEKLKEKKIKKPQKDRPYRYLREFKTSAFAKASADKKNSQPTADQPQPTSGQPKVEKVEKAGKFKTGDKIDVSVFKEGDKVKISGISKGKGFAGAVKRWGFHGRPATHGTKHEERTIGSTGSRFPQRVVKGRKMPGRMGSERVTVKNLKIVKVDVENNLLAVMGAIPGKRGTLLEIRGE